MGLETSEYSFYDVLSTEEWALSMVPRPVLGVIMLYPVKDTPEIRGFRDNEQRRIENEGQHVSDRLFYTKQTIKNACGTIALLNCVGNVLDHVTVRSGSYLDRFYARTSSMTAEERAEFINQDEEIEAIHETATQQGVTECGEDVNTHFVCFSCVEGNLYELDGRKSCPINHGPCNPEAVLERSCEEIRSFMSRDPGEMRFTIIAFAKKEDC
eukprot:CAMPEP_0185037272 /NCGR_PEP_ID=MMETSP1103-20130426/31437_1 /TAXON_ID=36769 /ORGANISM="Paraphysomonas bandaiensis, Strain Caron Lab Isolate" /LENGTH=211 /DNA_ID=CAMNT_0027575175 /DNA_START=57 /DNA_END=692 /DNA_ORIENTATION=+